MPSLCSHSLHPLHTCDPNSFSWHHLLGLVPGAQIWRHFFDWLASHQPQWKDPRCPSILQGRYSGWREKNKVRRLPWALRLLFQVSESCRYDFQDQLLSWICRQVAKERKETVVSSAEAVESKSGTDRYGRARNAKESLNNAHMLAKANAGECEQLCTEIQIKVNFVLFIWTIVGWNNKVNIVDFLTVFCELLWTHCFSNAYREISLRVLFNGKLGRLFSCRHLKICTLEPNLLARLPQFIMENHLIDERWSIWWFRLPWRNLPFKTWCHASRSMLVSMSSWIFRPLR